jgi:acetyl-CoA carboxylase carboxyltransferase component
VLFRDRCRRTRPRRGAFVGLREQFFNPYRAADVGQIDEVIEPHETRPRLIRALEVLRTKVQLNPAKKHGLDPS